MKQTRALALGLVAAGGILALGFAASPASATEGRKPLPKCHSCATTTRTDATGILTTSNGEAKTEGNPASSAVVVVGNGVEVTLPDATAKAGYTVAVDEPVLLSAVAKLSYLTWQLNPSSVALPSLNLTLDFNGADVGGFTTLVYEPYQDGRTIHPNQWQTWDALRGGDAKWWSTRAIPGGATQATPMSWDSILAANPNAVMKAWGLNFGKGAAGAHARWGAVTIGTIDWCTTTVWTKPKSSPSASPSATVSPTVVPTTPSAPPTSPPATSPQPHSPSPEISTAPTSGPGGQGGIGQGPGELALTGSKTPLWAQPGMLAGSALTAIGLGVGLVAFVSRKRRKFTA